MRSGNLYAVAEEAKPAVRRFVDVSRVRVALLITSSGQVVAQHGFTRALDVAATATLAAGIHASSGALARMIGGGDFRQSSGSGAGTRVFMGAIDGESDHLILVALLGSESTLGLVRIFFDEFRAEVRDLPSWRAARAVRAATAFETELEAGVTRIFR